jgi:hypothetical protein
MSSDLAALGREQIFARFVAPLKKNLASSKHLAGLEIGASVTSIARDRCGALPRSAAKSRPMSPEENC